MAKTLLELFRGSPQDLAVQPDTETWLEEETTGLRVKSAVELNNPLIYGNEAGRIMLRSTPSLELMRDSMEPEGGTKGLLGKGLSILTGGKIESVPDVRNKINDFLGIPQPLIPTRVYQKMDENPYLTVQDILDQKNGTEFGKFLKQTGGGTPKTIVNQAIGNAITLGKDLLRDTLFGKAPTIKEIAGIKTADTTEYTWNNTYTDVQKDLDYTTYKTPDELLTDTWELKRINLATVSPIYGVDRNSDLRNNSKLGNELRLKGGRFSNGSLQKYSADNKYRNFDDKSSPTEIGKRDLETRYGLSNIADDINLAGGKNETRTTEELEGLDLVPFWIGEVGSNKKTHFRTIITGLTETVTPSWDSNSFFGNPFKFHTYSSIERSTSFTLQLYCSNVAELLRSWERVNTLTKYTYPTIKTHETGKYADPPIIDFRLGDVYNRKIGFIESLSYTYPDNGVWETDPEIGLLPKFIEVSITIKFIEDHSITNKKYYDYKLSSTSTATMNDENGSNTFDSEPIMITGKRKNIGKLDSKGLAPLTNNQPKIMTSLNGIKSATPYESQNKTDATNITEPNIPNTTSDKSIEELINEAQSTLQLSKRQAELWITSLKPDGYKQRKNLSGLNVNPGDVAFTHTRTPDVLIVDTDGNVRPEEQSPDITNTGNIIDSLLKY